MHPIKDIHEYKRIKETLRARFEAERTGDQDLFREQSKIFEPLTTSLKDTQHQTVKAITDGQDTAISNALLPYAMELQRRNDQVDMLAEQPFYEAELPAIAPISPDFMKVDLDGGLNETDKENLQDMDLELPSKVFKEKIMHETLEKVKTQNRSIGQKLGKSQKLQANEKEIYESRKKTLETYRDKIIGLLGARQFVSTPKKVGNGHLTRGCPTDVIYYSNVGDLCSKLCKLDAAKQAGNTGLDNNINSILDELLRIGAINKDEYNTLYKNIFQQI